MYNNYPTIIWYVYLPAISSTKALKPLRLSRVNSIAPVNSLGMLPWLTIVTVE